MEAPSPEKAPKRLSTGSKVRHFGHMATYHNSNIFFFPSKYPQGGMYTPFLSPAREPWPAKCAAPSVP